MQNICSKIGSGSTPRGSNYAKQGIPFFRSQNIYNYGLVFDDIKYISENIHKTMLGTEVIANDLLLNITGGSLGRCAVVPNTFSIGNVSQHVCILRPIQILPFYIHCFICSTLFKQSMNLTGSGREGLPKYSLEIMQIPLPPIEEQNRIVIEVEKWFKLIDTIEQNQTDLKTAIEQTKSKVLDLAIHGKLVPQDPNDEPASELLKRINPNAEITCDNGHYAHLPKNWYVTTMQTICKLTDGKKSVGVDRINLDVKYLRGEKEGKTLKEGKFVPLNSLMILVDGENSGEIFSNKIEGYQGSTFKLLDIHPMMYKEYVLHVIRMYQKLFRESKVGSAIPHLNKKLFREITVPIPPFEEQKRIVNIIKRNIEVLDQISEAL